MCSHCFNGTKEAEEENLNQNCRSPYFRHGRNRLSSPVVTGLTATELFKVKGLQRHEDCLPHYAREY